MIIKQIEIRRRKSQDVQGIWRTLELGIVAEVEHMETVQAAWEAATAAMDAQWAAMWGNPAAQDPAPAPAPAPASVPNTPPLPAPVQAPAQPAAPPEHWCSEHNTAYTKKTGRDGSTWWSHKTADGWCNENG